MTNEILEIFGMNVGDFLVLREKTQVLNAPLDEEKFIDDFFVFHTRVFEIFDISAFLFHLGKKVSELFLIGDKLLVLRDLHNEFFKNSQIFLNILY